jgi:hypothetical protein
MRTKPPIAEATIFTLLTQQLASALMITLAWDQNTEPDIDHYTLKWGFIPNAEDHNINVGNVTTYTVTEPWSTGMTIYFVVTATNLSNLESGPSNEVSWTVTPWNPNAPGHLKIQDVSK